MNDSIRIQTMDIFQVVIDEKINDDLTQKSPKGAALMQMLIMSRGEMVSTSTLISTLWNEDKFANPENALKTLVSRIRTLLNTVYPDLGKCIVSKRGFYYWQSIPGMYIDVYEIMDILDKLETRSTTDAERIALTEQLIKLYQGDYLAKCDINEFALNFATNLHNRFVSALTAYIELLKEKQEYNTIIYVCRAALAIDSFEESMHMELMNALILTGHTNEAMNQYKHVTRMYYRYLGMSPSDEMLDFYKRITSAGKALDLNLESIRRDLAESGEQSGAFICEYVVFKEIFNLQMRNLERLNTGMFLGLIMISPEDGDMMDNIKQDNIMQGLMQILKQHLRKGDTVTQYSPNVMAMLLPTVNYSTGNMIMNRIKQVFYRKYPNSNVNFTYKIGPLGSDMERETREIIS